VNLNFPYNEFFDDYFRIKRDESDTPYFVPFNESETDSIDLMWFNQNVAGTYAPSSVRSTSPLLKIAEIEQSGHNSKWALTDEHWKLARHELADGSKIPVESLAAFLFRDYAFTSDDPSAFTVVEAFVEEFGYELGGRDFTHLYKTGDSNITKDSFDKYD
jgi:hypothetical protein